MSPLFLDANVPMYAAGQPHPLKAPCRLIMELLAERPRAFFTDAEVLQELVHRYVAMRNWSQGREVFHRFAQLMRDRVEPVYARDVEQAASLADHHAELGSRDLLHAAVMARRAADRIVSADQGFDRLPQLERLAPANFSNWRGLVEV